MKRPKDLPEFDKPPLDELVLGVQFTPPSTYNDTYAQRVWDLFKADFPVYAEQPRLLPSFETFGGSGAEGLSLQINLQGQVNRNRYWFSSKDETHLIQFQDDRLHLNWRRRPARENQYPRFDRIQTIFQGLLEKLSSFFEGEGSRLIIQQSEVSYINVILFDDGVPLRDWFTFINQSPLKLESLNAIFTEVVRSETNQPIARMSYELNSVVSVPERKPAVRLAITYRGKPAGETTISARDFLFTGRERIVRRFCELTSAKAHERWGRKN